MRVTGAPGAYTIPADVDAGAVLGDRRTEVARQAVLALRPERAGALRARAVPPDPAAAHAPAADPAAADVDLADPRVAAMLTDRDLVRVPFTQRSELADEIAGYADAVVVLGPADLRDAVLRRLRAAATLDRPPVPAPAAPGARTRPQPDATEATRG
ncbi:WYL domain-containing protein [Cellulomonas sp. ATA003]|uniref:WYL domain-containing protein n=1 Tax=Cellulomonas sp. ATA003 TaxID=3073064 RepID=UPI0028738FBA|nr:WYL domain-containing protein [Cellulomonas sp. ATA003]WNB87643.1 hypothetical protein REH70_10190 [Cellulomonas sp. ATA003]